MGDLFRVLISLPDQYRAVLTGATGGIGSALVEILQADPSCGEVVALSRSTKPAIDLEDEASIAEAAERTGRDGPVHLIIDATGILHDASMQPEKSIDTIDPQVIARSFAINATGPLLLLKHFHRKLPRNGRSIFATLSARVGSITDNKLGGWYGYRASKAALNMFLRTGAIELARKRPDAVCLALHPGTVRTGLSKPFSGDRETFSPHDAAERLLEVIDKAEPTASGAFLAYDGSSIPW